MKYPEKYLAGGETIIFDVHHHPVVLWRPAALAVLLVGLWGVSLYFIPPARNRWAVLAVPCVLLLIILYLAWRIIVLLHVNLVLTNRRLIYRSGVFTGHSREIPIQRIIHVSCSQTAMNKILGAGEITVFSDAEPRRTTFVSMSSPELLRAKISDLVHAPPPVEERARREEIEEEVVRAMSSNQPTIEMPPIPPERPPLYTEIVDQIERLDGMRIKGVISDEEFEQAKAKLLSRLDGEG